VCKNPLRFSPYEEEPCRERYRMKEKGDEEYLEKSRLGLV
jgi:hypothetical protein